MAGGVEHLRKVETTAEEKKAEPVFPGVNASISFQIGEKKGIHLQTMFLRDDPGTDQEKCLAKIMGVTAVIGLRETLIEHKREKANAERRLSELQSDPERKTALQSEIEALRLEYSAHLETEEKKFRASGRQGRFELAGHAKGVASRIAADRDKKELELKTLDSDLDRQRDELKTAIKNYGVAIANTESEIAIRREAYGD